MRTAVAPSGRLPWDAVPVPDEGRDLDNGMYAQPPNVRWRKIMTSPLNAKPNAEPLPRSSGASIILNGRYCPPPADSDGKMWVRTTMLVKGEPRDLYGLWRNIEATPLWQEQIVSVVQTGERTSHWVMRSGSSTIEWDSEVLADEPGRRIAWRSIRGDSDNAGEVIFEPAPGGRGTLVTVLQEFRMGKLASAWETIRGRNPKQAVIENLRHFKALVETGEIPRTQGQPHGPRGAIGAMKASAYAETTVTPPGLERKAS